MFTIVALANVNDTKRSAVDQLCTAFRSVVEGERALISFGHGAGKPSITFGCATTSATREAGFGRLFKLVADFDVF